MTEYRTTCTSGDKYYYYPSCFDFDIYRAKRDVLNPEGYGIIPAGSKIADVTYTLGIFKRMYARIMGYTAWCFVKAYESLPMDYYWIKSLSLYRKSSFFELEGTSILPKRTPFQRKVMRIKNWFSEKFHKDVYLLP